ncbi:hypothetical protein GY21_16900 [Cryobacterium roopkundense]|uniref:Ribosomal protein S18 acetylase RimI-like enzyme n=1 Tax=Cryobacterium roopkundense TaxID=1001240 RepID=A0A099J1A7_9MICO|nr:GNAT family acetyltransferase [Cryobacterium roopkundense]KGJ72204.1 hypothetical protein GY21_16900 [Cryobacterium roopkundense]MBB5641962.1 ribosomal protein S18 acetylase RimI-like enzyme [Cryobacterium roopkundense]
MIMRPFNAADTDAVVQLWTDCGLTRPQNNPLVDIERKLAVQPELFLVGTVQDAVMGSIMAGYDGHRGWVNYLAVSPEHQGAGFGRRLMGEVERLLLKRGCPKVNLQIRAGNERAIAFYRALGYAADEAVSFGKRIIPD